MATWTPDDVFLLPSVAYADRRRHLPDAPGLYFAVKDGTEVVYVGMARKSIQRRWKQWHHAACAIDRRGFADSIRIAYLLTDQPETLRDAEREAIVALCPMLNFNHVPGALERQRQMDAEACEWVDCNDHWHERWPPKNPPTKTRPCVCRVHASCEAKAAG